MFTKVLTYLRPTSSSLRLKILGEFQSSIDAYISKWFLLPLSLSAKNTSDLRIFFLLRKSGLVNVITVLSVTLDGLSEKNISDIIFH